MEVHMRFTRKVVLSVATAAAALAAAPALASAAPTPPPIFGDQPCGPGYEQVWVDREGTPPKLLIDQFGRITLIPGDPPFHGYECQKLVLKFHP
jgi:hypothetical protein